MTAPIMVTSKEIAEMLGYRVSTIYKLHQTSEQSQMPEPAERIGNMPRWRKSDIEKWIRDTGRPMSGRPRKDAS